MCILKQRSESNWKKTLMYTLISFVENPSNVITYLLNNFEVCNVLLITVTMMQNKSLKFTHSNGNFAFIDQHLPNMPTLRIR